MTSLESIVCPCCTGAIVQALAIGGTAWLTPNLFLELGKGALEKAIGRESSNVTAGDSVSA